MSHRMPGTCANYCIITDDCRVNRTDEGAFEEAVKRLLGSYLQATRNFGRKRGARFHLALTIERPPHESDLQEGS